MKPESKRSRSGAAAAIAAAGTATDTDNPTCFDLTNLSRALDREVTINNRNSTEKSAYDLSDLSKALKVSVVDNKKRRVSDTFRRFNKLIDLRNQMERDKKAKRDARKASRSAMNGGDERERLDARFNGWQQQQICLLLSAQTFNFKD